MHEIILFTATFFAAGINAVAGGGTFLIFPALIYSGLSPLMANATSTVALWPGSIASAMTFRKSAQINPNFQVPGIIVISVLGGAIGAWLLVILPERIFENLIPILLFIATLVFASSSYIKRKLIKGSLEQSRQTHNYTGLLIAQFIVSIYGGFFGAGIGILMLAIFAFTHIATLNEANSIKTLLSAAVNSTAVIIFSIGGLVDWHKALIMAMGGILGAYVGARLSLKAPEKWIRYIIVLTGFGLSVHFALKYWI